MDRILITGANGFVGSAIHRYLYSRGTSVRGAVRAINSIQFPGAEYVVVGDLSTDIDWSIALADISVVIHTAARVHIMRDTSADPLAEFRRVNVRGTLNLARQAVVSGVKRFVFISSIKVNGEVTSLDQPYTANNVPAPVDFYAISKYEAEEGLRSLAEQTGLEVVIVRPPLTYGPGVKANFLSMMRWLYRGVPLPFGLIQNKRSLVALDNLVNLIVICIIHPSAANQTFLVSDGYDLSTVDLLELLGKFLGRPARLMSVPISWLEICAGLFGKKAIIQRLCNSLQVDITKTQILLDWNPPVSVEEALQKTALDFLESN